jgi:hypothetical protein
LETDLKRRTADPSRRLRPHAVDQGRELALLAEFMRHDSVASLASEIAGRLGVNMREKDLIAAADLGESRCDS